MRSTQVVVGPPSFDLAPGIVDRQELVSVETFIVQLAVEQMGICVPGAMPSRLPHRLMSLIYRLQAHRMAAIDPKANANTQRRVAGHEGPYPSFMTGRHRERGWSVRLHDPRDRVRRL